MRVLGWYSLIFIMLSVLMKIGDNKLHNKVRVLGVILATPILLYIAFNLFQ